MSAISPEHRERLYYYWSGYIAACETITGQGPLVIVDYDCPEQGVEQAPVRLTGVRLELICDVPYAVTATFGNVPAGVSAPVSDIRIYTPTDTEAGQ